MARGRFEAIDGGAIFIGVLLLEVSAVVTLNIRNLPDEVQAALRARAAKAARSMEAEAGAILTEACMPRQPTGHGRRSMWARRSP